MYRFESLPPASMTAVSPASAATSANCTQASSVRPGRPGASARPPIRRSAAFGAAARRKHIEPSPRGQEGKVVLDRLQGWRGRRGRWLFPGALEPVEASLLGGRPRRVAAPRVDAKQEVAALGMIRIERDRLRGRGLRLGRFPLLETDRGDSLEDLGRRSELRGARELGDRLAGLPL